MNKKDPAKKPGSADNTEWDTGQQENVWMGSALCPTMRCTSSPLRGKNYQFL